MTKMPSASAPYTITRLASLFRLSRSTLLYYDRIGLLRPSNRSTANYRLYSEADRQRLAKICRFREAGLSLGTIGTILSAPRPQVVKALELRLAALNREIHELRAQQRVIVDLLNNPRLLTGARALDKQRWVAVLRAAGMDDAAMWQWHVAFERMSAEAHQDFLESLGINAREIDEIRAWSAKPSH